MNDEDMPQWLRETGRRPMIRHTGRPVPPISGSVRVERDFNETRALSLERDLNAAIQDSTPEQENYLHVLVLDYMTANRLSSGQAYRLLLSLWAKNGDLQPGLSRVDSSGNLESLAWEAI